MVDNAMALATLIFVAMAGIGSVVILLPKSAVLTMGAKTPSKVRATAKISCIYPWTKAWNPRGCEGWLLEPLSVPDYCVPKAKALYARKQASESSQDAA
jgi:hypothetical protein